LEAALARARATVGRLRADNAHLEAENAALRRRLAQLEVLLATRGGTDAVALRRRIVELEARVAELTHALHEAQRAARRQAAPFARRRPRCRPKQPGRKPGHPGAYCERPTHVDETVEVPLPDCPDCHGQLRRRRRYVNWVLDVPQVQPRVIQYVTEGGWCARCCKHRRSRHPDQPSVAQGAAAVALGPNALALAATLKVRHHVAMRRVAELFAVAFGLSFTAGGLAQALQRLGRRLDATYQALIAALRVSDAVFCDETGWRIVRATCWLWVLCTPQVTVYVVDARRNHEVPLRLLGAGFAGILHHDGARSYDVLPFLHQTCLEHILRDLDELGQVKTRGAVRWPRAVAGLLREAMALRRSDGVQSGVRPGDPSDRIEKRLDRLLLADLTDADNVRMRKRLVRNRDVLLPFLYLEEAEATNNRAERQLRPILGARKIGAGNRSQVGARAHQIVASIVATARQQGHNEVEVLAEAARSPPGAVVTRLVPAAARASPPG
jgi:transposase